jgi:hypothetical protein
MVELLFGRAALPRTFDGRTVQQVGGEAGHAVSGFSHWLLDLVAMCNTV